MFRLRASYIETEFGIEVRIRSANFNKCISIRTARRGANLKGEVSYQLLRRSRELIRDELFHKYGGKWYSNEIKHWKYINKSLVSCAKRMKQIIKG